MGTAENLFEPPSDEEDFGLPSDEIEDMRRIAAEMSDAEFEKFRKASAKIIPMPLFDLIMAGIREKSSRKPKSEQRRRAGRRTNQPDLFS